MSAARILVVDDDAIIRITAGEALRAAAYEVSEAESGEDALASFEAHPPDLVLLDVMLPGISGFEVCERIRAMPGGARVPIVMLTGLEDATAIDMAFGSGATDFITKPLVLGLLAYRIRYALRVREMLDDLTENQSLLANAQQLARLGTWEYDPATGITKRSEEMLKILGAGAAELAGDPYAVLRVVHPQDRDGVAAALKNALRSSDGYQIDYRIVGADGGVRHVFEQTVRVLDASGRRGKIRGITQDITDRVEAEQRIRRLANYDAVTGLPNRARFMDRLSDSLRQGAQTGSHSAVLSIDIDRFQRINETLGHSTGDEVLRVIATRLMAALRSADSVSGRSHTEAPESVGHFGGDEFTVMLSDLPRPELADRIARRLLEVIAEPVQANGHEIAVTASIGIAVHPQDGEDAEALMRNADTALNSAKAGTRNAVSFYRQEMSEAARAKMSIESDLRKALDREELRLYYQAKVDGRSGAIVGAEALIRWIHPERGMVSPLQFIPVAEESGLIIPITERVIQMACQQLAAWGRRGVTPVPVSINLSAPSFRQRGLPATIRHALESAVVPAELLECEMTESVLMDDLGRAVSLLDEMKEMGLSLAVDDFGTGYSSLTYLKRFPIDVLKIDRSFVSNVTGDAGDGAICSAIIAMGRQLDLDVIAEGVETADQARYLLERHCHLMQGFLFARPVPAEEFTRMLAERTSFHGLLGGQVAAPTQVLHGGMGTALH